MYPHLKRSEIPNGTTHIFTGGDDVAVKPHGKKFEKHINGFIYEWKEEENRFTFFGRQELMDLRVRIQDYLAEMENSKEEMKKGSHLVILSGGYNAGKSKLMEDILKNTLFGEKEEGEGNMKTFKLSDLKTGMVVATRSMVDSELKYGVVLEDENDMCIRYFTESQGTLFDSLDIIDNETFEFNVGNKKEGGIYEIYAHNEDGLRQTPFTMNQFNWALKHGFYEKIWERNDDKLVPNGTKIYHNITRQTYVVSIISSKSNNLDKFSIINIDEGTRFISEGFTIRGNLTFSVLKAKIKDVDPQFHQFMDIEGDG